MTSLGDRDGRRSLRLFGAVGLGFAALGCALWWMVVVPLSPYPLETDFMALYTGGSLGARPAELYDLEIQYEVETGLGATLPFASMAPFLYPPYAIFLFAPLALLPFVFAFWSWVLLSVMMYAGGVAAWSGITGSRRAAVPIVTAGLGFLPLLYSMFVGQVTALVFLLLSLALVAFARGRDARGGLWIGCLAFKPQLALVWGLVLVAGRRWRAAATAVAVVLVLVLVFTLVWGPGIWVSYLDLLREVNAAGPDAFQLNVSAMTSWRGWLTLVTDWRPRTVGATAAGLGLAVVIVTLLAWRGEWRPRGERFAWQVSATVLAVLLVSPHSHIQETALLWLAALWVAGATGSSRPLWGVLVLGSPFFLLLVSGNIPGAWLTPLLLALWLAAVVRTRSAA